jgi:hypothetical protein
MAIALKAPVTFEEVMLQYPASKSEYWNAKVTLTIDAQGLAITVTKVIMDKLDMMGTKIQLPIGNIAMSWDDLRSLDDSKIGNNEFSAYFGSGKNYVSYKLRINNPDPQAVLVLKDILHELPEYTRLPRCVKCGGWVKENVCGKCGAKATSEARKRGMLLIGGGLLGMFILAKFVYPIGDSGLHWVAAKYVCAFGGFVALLAIGIGILTVVTGKT